MSLQKWTSEALQTIRGRAEDLALRMSDYYQLPVLWQRYRKNTLTHGIEYLRGDESIKVFCPNTRGLPPWRPIPAAGVPSLSKANVVRTEEGGMLLRGEYSGLTSGMQLLRSEQPDAPSKSADDEALWAGAVGMGSSARWDWDVSQHHWLEIRFRSDGRQYELVVQNDAEYGNFRRFWRANIPPSPAPSRVSAALGSGPYALLGLPRDASADEIRIKYMELVKSVHPDAGGSEERFKAVRRALDAEIAPRAGWMRGGMRGWRTRAACRAGEQGVRAALEPRQTSAIRRGAPPPARRAMRSRTASGG